jgi:hypothetical protein
MENGRDHQSQKIAGLKDGLRHQDRQRGIQEAEPVTDGKGDRNDKQKRHERQQNPQSERNACEKSKDR